MMTIVDDATNGIVFYDNPMMIDKYKFLYEHLDCDSIIKINEDVNDRIVYVIACAKQKEFNGALEDLYYKKNYSGKYVIMQGIDSREVNSID